MLRKTTFSLFALLLLCGVSLGQNLDAHWTFDTDFTDATGNGHTGVGNGTAAVTNTAGDFKIGSGALTLDSSGDFVETSIDNYKGVGGTAARTVSAWIRTSETGAARDQAIISWGDNVTGEKWVVRTQITNGTQGALRTEVNGGYSVGSTVLDDGVWRHVAVTFENDGTPNVQDVLLYVNGQLETVSASLSQAINTAVGDDVQIGTDSNNRAWGGELDDVGIFTEALSPEKIAAIFSLGTNAELGYDLSDDDALFALFESGDPSASVEIDGLTWQFVASGLGGTPGQVDGAGGSFSLLLDPTNGSGLQTFVIPEPASIAIWSLLALILTGYGYARRRKA